MLRITPCLPAIIAGALFSASAIAAPYIPPTVTVEYEGQNYTISSQLVSYTGNSAALISQPWWGNASLAFNLADLVKVQAGEFLGPGSGYGALFGYGTSSGYVSIAYWNGAQTIDCPLYCPNVSSDYYYAYLVSLTSLVTLQSLADSLVSSASGADAATTNASMLINGAHSRPLSRRVEVGEKTAWVAGDLGRDDHGSRNGSTGVAEIGGGYNFGPTQINLIVGKTWGNYDLVSNGNLDAEGQYVMAESIMPVSESYGLFATVGAFGHWGEADIRRGYMNGGLQDFSNASPDTRIWGVRARLDWENAFAVKSVGFSPYADLSYTHSHMEGYTENGGGLPARFDARSDDSTELRLGLNAAMPIKATKLSLVANLEAAHRFNDEGASSSGEVIGLFTFNLPGEDYQSSWLKAGVGVEGGFGNGKASLMLNGTTNSAMPSAWLAASYQLDL